MTRWSRREPRRWYRGAAVAAALLSAYGLGAATAETEPSRIEPASHEDGLLEEATDRIATSADQPVSRAELREAAISGMLRSLGDPWARYYPPQEYDDFTGWLNGDHKTVRPEPQRGDVVVDRAEDLTVVRVAVFTRGVGAQVRTGVSGSRAVLLDLRGNPGGLLDEAVDTASAFLEDGPVVTYERRGEPAEVISVTSPGDSRVPVVVLVDKGTASAAEIVTGALRDRDRAVIVGSATFGKGTVQEPVRLSDGSAVELTVGRYLTPAGHNLEGVGIEPDITAGSSDAEERGRTVLDGLTGS
ncbi:S41 family peptidase [Actinocorallia libanotica]|uniref:Tail specific protease domain-containing protein n=1 Tax=Actinocorallia libanotica TaxID=46162 RepID=A0ABP4C1V1_9ACTN